IVEPWVTTNAPEVLEDIDIGDRAVVKKGRLPEEIWDSVDILFLSMAYPNPFRLRLVYEAAKRNIPVTAVEEVNQLALNDGIINHYFLPIDHFGVPSKVEKEKFMALGIPRETLSVTGWPFFNRDAAADQWSDFDLKKEYNVPGEKKCCLLVLGSLKEFDIVSLESRKVRREILEIVSGGLTQEYQLLIKPHPIETESALRDIQKQVPDAILITPKHPIEPLLMQADVIVNRGNSQVVLLAMKRPKPLIVVPAGLNTIFHGNIDHIIARSPAQFKELLEIYSQKRTTSYEQLLNIHYPLNQEEALTQVNQLFQRALETGVPTGKDKTGNKTENKTYTIAILFAFLEDISMANQVLETGRERESERDKSIVGLLKKLFRKDIRADEFKELLDFFPAAIQRWHLQALFIRSLYQSGDKQAIQSGIGLMEGFDGSVNPHYFIHEIVKCIELVFKIGQEEKAEALINKFYGDYAVFDYFKQAFNMMRFVYNGHRNGYTFRKTLWLISHLNKGYTRKYIKEKLTRMIGVRS
ncbi:MAG: hypothetical protein GY940_09630, partial [bacterium]|nr:hypothetical protein [bacterium]